MAPPSFMTTSPDKPEMPPTDWKGVSEENKIPSKVDPGADDEVSVGGAPSSNYKNLPNAEKLSLWKNEFMTHTPQGEKWDKDTLSTKKMRVWFNFYLTELQGKTIKKFIYRNRKRNRKF